MKKIITIITLLFMFSIGVKAQVGLLPGQQLSYLFSGNANDNSGNGYNGTVVGATLTNDRFGAANSAYNFNGSSFINSNNILNSVWAGSGKKFTFSVWVRPDVVMSNNMIIAKSGDGACGEDQRQFYLRIFNSKVMFTQSGALAFGSFFHAIGNTLITNTTHWYHIVCEYDGTVMTGGGLDRVKIWVDDIPEVISAGAASVGTLGDIQIGTNALGVGTYISSSSSSCGSFFFYGDIDDIGVFDRLLDSTEINTIYTAPFTGIAELNGAIEFTISPNPFNSQTTITFKESQKDMTVKIVDVLGKEIKSMIITGKEFVLESSEMKAGVYFVQLIDGQKMVTAKKIIVQ